MLRYVSATVVAIAAMGLVQPAHSAVAAPTALTRAQVDAAREARESGRSVEVADQTTENRQVRANPDGTFTLTSNRRAVRVKKDGAWKAIDTTLRRNGNGSWSPGATTMDVAFSGGGSGPLVTGGPGGASVADWPDPLPAPTISGDTATYPGVLPGVDLRLKAQPDGYSRVLVTWDAEGAAHPALAGVEPNQFVSRPTLHWMEVDDNGTTRYDWPEDARVGNCGWPECGSVWRARSYFQFDVSPLWASNGFLPTIASASLVARQVWSPDGNCGSGQPTAVYEAGEFWQGTRWPGPAGVWLDTQYLTAGRTCPVRDVAFDVWWAARHASDGHWSSLVLGLVAAEENDAMQWKKFSNNPTLIVDFSFPGTTATPATTASALECAASTPIYTTRSSTLRLTLHAEPETGLNSWSPQQSVGTGFGTNARRVAGPGGVIYSAVDSGELRRRRWNGTGWDTFAGGAQYEVIDTNPLWARYSTPEYFNRITVDANGDIYTVEPDGNLHWRRYNPATRTWAHRVVDGSWDHYNLIVAAGDGVLYARGTHRLDMDRYRYHAALQRLTYDSGHLPGSVDWHLFVRVFSPGGDVLYGVKSNGDLLWYRYNEDTNTWANGAGRVVSTGWQNEYETFAAPDACRRVGGTGSTRPPITPQPMAPVTLMRSGDGHVHYSYVDSEGRAVYADAADLTGGTPIRLGAVPGMLDLTGVTALAENQDGRVQIAGTGLDAEVRANTRTAVNGLWGDATGLGGFVTNSVALGRLANRQGRGTIAGFAVDQDGLLRFQLQAGANGPTTAWKCVGNDAGTLTPRLGSDPLVVVPAGGQHFRIIGKDRTGTILVRSKSSLYLRGCDTTFDGPQGRISGTGWVSLGDSGFLGAPSAVIMPGNLLQIFATGSDGVVYTIRETSGGGWPGTWTPVATGLTASGAPSAIIAPDGMIKVVARGTDGFVYYTTQTASGSTTYTPWQEITGYTEESATDPAALAVPAAGTWVVAYRTDLDVPRLRRYQPSAPAIASSTFVNLPIEAPES